MSATKRKPKRYVRVGESFGRLTVEGEDAERSRVGKRYVWCRCSCGNRISVRPGSLTGGNTESCGCLRLERVQAAGRRAATHGESRGGRQSKAYRTYVNMLKRCYDPKCPMYPRYGGRGIVLCARWKADRGAFFTDMGTPTAEQSIDRIDNDGGYWCGKSECPECGPIGRVPNCRWASAAEQASNKANSRMLTHDGRTQSMAAWAKETGVPYGVIQARLDQHGWDTARTLTTSVRKLRLRT